MKTHLAIVFKKRKKKFLLASQKQKKYQYSSLQLSKAPAEYGISLG